MVEGGNNIQSNKNNNKKIQINESLENNKKYNNEKVK
jgi:hypothetical protein